MSLINKISQQLLGITKSSAPAKGTKDDGHRRCRFEVLEERRVLSADPVIAGVTYLEGDEGQDTTPDYFEVSFEGGSETTELAQFTINGDQDSSGGLTDGDIFFDVNQAQPGTGGSHAFEFDAANSQGVNADDIRGVTVSSDGLLLTVNVDNFEAGDVFAFSIDVDEVESLRFDRITSGVEFEGSFFNATFQDEHFDFENRNVSTDITIEGGFVQSQQEGIFFDEYDQLFATGEGIVSQGINLPLDNETGQSDRTAGSIDAYNLIEKPISISGTVYHDDDLDCVHDGSEEGLANVGIELQQRNEVTGVFETVARTTTDANGDYEFGTDLGLLPGEYRLVQTQPDGFLDVGARAGSEGGTVSNDRDGFENVIGNINIELGNTAATDYDFKEVRPASLEGNVYHDRNDNGVQDPGEEGIANVLIQVTRVGAKGNVSVDPFEDTTPIFVRTDANGHYSVDGLPPGIYEVIEINNDPAGGNPLASFVDGQDAVGDVGGVPHGTQQNDRFSNIELCPGEHGEEYNFGELRPASISGYVSVDIPGQSKLDPSDPNFQPIEGVTIQLLDEFGNLVETTQTNADGLYEFDNLVPGTYSIVEVQPDGFLDGADVIGNVGNQPVGNVSNDRFDGIVIGSGQNATQYNFCEHEPASIKGTVYHDRNNNGIQDAGEEGIANVVIELMDADGNLISRTTTDANGDYCFEDLLAGEYMLVEVQPEDFIDGQESVGSLGGETKPDGFNVTLEGGDNGVNYDFGELLPAQISGFVHTDNNGDCNFDASQGEEPLGGVTIELLDSNGNVIQTTTTDDRGFYQFSNLAPGTYSLREVQPEDFFTGGERVSGGNGEATTNLLRNIEVGSGQSLTDFNFCEVAPAEIHGRVFEDGPAFETEDGTVPENFRSLRDGVFTAGVDTPLEDVRLRLFYFIDPDNSSIEPRPVLLSEVLPQYYPNLDSSDPNAEVFIDTNAAGEYWFQGLQPGSYIVLQDQPDGFTDANDIPGTTINGSSGVSFNSDTEVSAAISALTQTFSDAQLQDTVANIVVDANGISTQNNFTEVTAIAAPTPPPAPGNPNPAGPTTPPPIPNPVRPTPGITGFPGLAGAQTGNFISIVGAAGGQQQTAPQEEGNFSWHLSVVNGGLPRAAGTDAIEPGPVWQQAGFITSSDWNRFDANDALWTFTSTKDGEIVSNLEASTRFGVLGGIPLAGDFDGNGIDEVAIFKDGFWLIDVNHNGQWDKDDLLARLGDGEDRPVVGDWDGDGKDDIGIYGPMWERDREAIEREPGLPNPDNDPYTRPKNVPPQVADATNGSRVMKLTSYGREQADVVDHVFGLDEEDKIPVTGDWNGNGIRSIGTFRDGVWELDVNGDGKFDHLDKTVRFGRTGDVPVVGDFNGDGIEEIAIYRNGTWIIDSNGNRELDITDRTFELGGANDKPVAGDWDGDGTDEPAIYTEQQWNEFH